MKKGLFKPVGMDEIRGGSIFGNKSIDARSAYISGYYEAAKSLAEIAANTECERTRDTLIYPVCFNYRHYIELHLKSLIEDAESLYAKMEELEYLQNGNLPKKVTELLDKTHSLNVLMEYLIERLHYTQVSNEKFPKDIEKYIKQMHDSDKSGQKYRYHKNTAGKLHFPDEEIYDIENIANIMQEVYDLLWGIDEYLYCYNGMSDTILEEMNNYMGD
jgi:hypothetical protein